MKYGKNMAPKKLPLPPWSRNRWSWGNDQAENFPEGLRQAPVIHWVSRKGRGGEGIKGSSKRKLALKEINCCCFLFDREYVLEYLGCDSRASGFAPIRGKCTGLEGLLEFFYQTDLVQV